MAQGDQLDLLKLLLEGTDRVKDPGWRCQKLYEHGVTTLDQFAALSEGTLVNWGIANYYDDDVCISALSYAQELLRYGSHDLAAIKQQLLVRPAPHALHDVRIMCTVAE